MFDTTPRTKEDAQNECMIQDYWANLLVITTLEDAEFLKSAANQLISGGVVSSSFSYYIGKKQGL